WTHWLRSPRSTRVSDAASKSRSLRPRQPHFRRQRLPLTLENLEARNLFSVKALSLADAGLLSDTAAGNVQGPASVSNNGRYVVSSNTAANLAAGQVMASKSAMNVFLYDRSTGTTTLVSYAAGTTSTTANGTSRNAVISGDGNWIAYVSNSDNLIS